MDLELKIIKIVFNNLFVILVKECKIFLTFSKTRIMEIPQWPTFKSVPKEGEESDPQEDDKEEQEDSL